MNDPYRLLDDLPHSTLRAAATLDSTDRDLPDDDHVPIGSQSRWDAAIRLLQDLEDRRGVDTVRVLLAVVKESRLDTEDVERAIQREAKLKRSNQDDERRGGRPSKVDRLVGKIATHCSMANQNQYQGADNQIRSRDRQITHTLRAADISRRTFYNVRERVLDEQGIDISSIAPPSEVLM